MTISMYQASIPSLIRGLENLQHFLKAADAYAEANKIEHAVLTNARLYPNMLPLKWQIFIATDTAKFVAARLAEVEPPKLEDDQETFVDLGERIETTIGFLKTITASQIDGTEDKQVELKRQELTFTGQQYLLGYALPNFYFHVTTAYDILRHNGVPLGKRDFLGSI